MSVGIASTSVYFWGDGSSTSFNSQSGEHLRGLYSLIDPISMGQSYGYYLDGSQLHKSVGVGTAVNGISTVAYYVYNSEANSGAGQTALFAQDYNGSGDYYAWKIAHNFNNGVGLNTDTFPTTVEADGPFNSDEVSPAGYSGFYGSVQAIDPTGNFSQNSTGLWDGQSDLVIWNGDGSTNQIGIFTAVTGYGVNPGNSFGVASSEGQTYFQMAADAENDFSASADDAGFFWDSVNNQWQWMDDVNPPTDVSASSVKADGSWGSISTQPQGDSATNGNVVYLSLATLGYTEQQQQEEGGGGQVTAPTLKLKRGLQANLPTLSIGEPGFTTDSYQLYVGSPSGNKLIGGNDFFSLEGSTTGGGINLYEGTDNGTDFIQLRSPDSLAGITSYTLPAGASSGFMKITSSSNSGSNYEVTLGFASVLENLVDDTTPQLGGNLDLNSNNVTGTGDIDITGSINISGVATASNITDLQTLQGVSTGSTTLGTFTGSTINDNVDIKTALQELETQLDSVAGGGAQATSVSVGATDTNATHYLTFVDSNNASPTQEVIETDAGLNYNPSTNQLTAGGVNVTTLSLNGADVTATAAEINVLDGVTAGTATTTKALVVDDYGNLTNLGVVTATTFSGELDSTSITLAGLAVTAILDEDDLVSDRADALATQQSIKAYVDNNVGIQTATTGGDGIDVTSGFVVSVDLNDTAASYTDLTLTASGGGTTINLSVDSGNDLLLRVRASGGASTLTITGGTIQVGDTVRVYDDSNVAWQFEVESINTTAAWQSDLTAVAGTVTRDGVSVTNFKSSPAFDDNTAIAGPVSTRVDIVVVGNTSYLEISSQKLQVRVLDEDNLVSASSTHLATQQSIKAYVDDQVGAVVSTFDIAADSGSNDTVSTGQTITFAGSANEIITTVTDNQIEIGLRDDVIVGTSLSAPTLKASALQASDGTAAITITNSTGAVSIANSMTISGDLFVNGTTTEVNTTQLTVEDTLIELQVVDGGTLSGDTNKDVGMIFNYYDTAAKKAAVFWDDSTARVAFGASVTESSGVISVPDTQWAAIEAKELYISDSVGIASAIITTSGSDRVLQSVLIDCGSF